MRVLIAIAALLLVACGGGSDQVPVPDGVAFRVEQARQDLKTRNMQFQVVNNGDESITVSRVELTSGRFDGAAAYVGPATVSAGNRVNLTMEMPVARCGKGIDATARITYAVDGGKQRSSVVRPADHFDSVALFMKRDCAEDTVGDVTIDRNFEIRGTGRESVLEIGVTFTPKSSGETVRLGRVDGTTLLKFAKAADGAIDHDLVPGSEPYRTVLRIVPNRCDVHVVAEDRAGTVLPVHVASQSSGRAFFYLHFTEDDNAQIFDFIAANCGFGSAKDPVLAP